MSVVSSHAVKGLENSFPFCSGVSSGACILGLRPCVLKRRLHTMMRSISTSNYKPFGGNNVLRNDVTWAQAKIVWHFVWTVRRTCSLAHAGTG